MKQHPIPQDITNYSFHLIGNMTLKQFGELAAAGIIALIVYSTNLPDIFKWPLILLVVALGVMVAFVPIEERPLDHWIITFFKNLYHPTKFYWKKQEHIPEPFNYKTDASTPTYITPEVDLSPARKRRISEYLESIPTEEAVDAFDQAENQRVGQLLAAFDQVPVKAENVEIETAAKKPDLKVRVRSLKKNQSEEEPVINQPLMPEPALESPAAEPLAATPMEEVVATETTIDSSADEQNNYPQQDLSIDQLENLVEEEPVETPVPTAQPDLQIIYSQATPTEQNTEPLAAAAYIDALPVTTPTAEETPVNNEPAAEEVAEQATEDTVAVAAEPASQAEPEQEPIELRVTRFNDQLPMPARATEPNKLCGMVLNQAGELISNALVEVTDENGRSARIVKSNALGQFFISTPLKNGHYQLRAEADNYQFESFPMELKGKVLPPIEIRANN